MATVVDHADEQEERAGRDAVVHHLENGALHARRGRAEDPEHHVSEMRDRRVRDEAFEVGLLPRDERRVDDAAEDGETGERGREDIGLGREEAHREAQVRIRPELQHDRGEDHRAARRHACTCASGNHVWRGHIGTLMKNAIENARKQSIRTEIGQPKNGIAKSVFPGSATRMSER